MKVLCFRVPACVGVPASVGTEKQNICHKLNRLQDFFAVVLTGAQNAKYQNKDRHVSRNL